MLDTKAEIAKHNLELRLLGTAIPAGTVRVTTKRGKTRLVRIRKRKPA